MPSIKKISASRWTLFPDGRSTAIILSVSAVLCVVLSLMLGTGAPYISNGLFRLWIVTGQSMSAPLEMASQISLCEGYTSIVVIPMNDMV